MTFTMADDHKCHFDGLFLADPAVLLDGRSLSENIGA